ncbi:hypothetical protein MPER_04159, partial [Moniliophthora perniciosa FA553]
LADAAFQNGRHKLAMLAFACAYDRTTDERVRAYCIKRLFSCSEHSFHKLPRFFRWVIPYYLAAMSTPREAHDITLLASLGIKHVLTLTEETPLPEAWFRGKPITNTFLPIPNYHPPSIEQMDIVMRLMEDESKIPTLIHCGGGKGRAGSIETSQQEAFVSKWCSTIWKRQSIYPELPSESPPCPLEIEGTLEKSADLTAREGCQKLDSHLTGRFRK